MAEEKGCDIDDLMCQLQVQNHLEGMKNLLGTEKFRIRYPEFEGLGETIAERMKAQENTIQEAYKKCGMKAPEEETSEVEHSEPEENKPWLK